MGPCFNAADIAGVFNIADWSETTPIQFSLTSTTPIPSNFVGTSPSTATV
eukprot:CAMPEP_0176036012 /NCGR_PEP_ID=MMETSP0120_2-20121206/17831_1 /TAXON_ID=160619 /ORGANISM="Kryptoperidinium foliaceum, Strain CCMP 1326" /LENGTH=49 /DNA_ID= /DNA_START= /DNA_END= /DNA_ORIENTATION=